MADCSGFNEVIDCPLVQTLRNGSNVTCWMSLDLFDSSIPIFSNFNDSAEVFLLSTSASRTGLRRSVREVAFGNRWPIMK
jgi:hypothetical protein